MMPPTVVFVLLVVLAQTSGRPPVDTNIAKGGQVTQSSITHGGIPGRAIDGNSASNWRENSCTHTSSETKPWWRLDLLKKYKINNITITNRGDCCHDRINGAEIHIGNSLTENGNANPRCAVIPSVGAGSTKTFGCNGTEGRYVNIVIPGNKKILTLCEVEVTGQPSGVIAPPDTNIAKGGQVTQSSITHGGIPGRAIDGNSKSNWGENSCTHTSSETKPWWRLDLLKTYKINTITITNRGDCCHDRINGAEIRIGNSLRDNGNANPRCAVIPSVGVWSTKTFVCNGTEGRYVNIVIPGNKKILTLCEVEVTGQPSEVIAPTDTNIAKGGQVTQSSITHGGIPGRAIDGNSKSNWRENSCTHTSSETKPWWRLDLLKKYKINTITIINRGDCCHDRINGAEIHIGNSLTENGNANPRCAVIPSVGVWSTKTVVCNGMEGRYVNIVIPGNKKILTLCEVEVTGQPSGVIAPTDTNIAKGGQVTQSSITHGGIPGRAIDGNSKSNWGENSCTHTSSETKPWWRLDLLKKYKINTITIINRGDCCHDRINGAEIRIGNSLTDNGNANPRCAVIPSVGVWSTKTVVCNGMEGRYVNIVIPGNKKILTLCEVEVTGQPSGVIAPTDTNIAKGGQVTQSSITHGGIPGRAIDGNSASNWRENSCTHTSSETKPWWRLDLLKTNKIDTITIINRGDCCHDRINGAEIRIGNSLRDNGNANPRCAVIPSVGVWSTKTVVCNGMEGRYVNIVIPGNKKILTLCEVEVTGQLSGVIAPTDTNIAKGGQVTQSSITHGGIPGRAIDGNSKSNWRENSCTHTSSETKPWWRLNLLKKYKINTITIINRGDCCHDRINGAEIRIGNSLRDNGNANPRCAVIPSVGVWSTKTVVCNGMEGRYVNIVIPGNKKILTLCEVEVTGQLSGVIAPTDTNIAKGGQVTQSSITHGGIPGRAIDGNSASNWRENSCTHTSSETKPWWRLDLLKTNKINNITIINRGDCCHDRINGAEIRIGNSLRDNGNANPRCAVIPSVGVWSTKTVVCNGMEGRYVNIVIPGNNKILTLCEVEVTDQLSGVIPPPGTNIAKGGQVTQSSITHGGIPGRAVDGNSASNWRENSCTHTSSETKPWWRLDLQKTYKINTITIINRGDCCHDRINGAEIRIGNSLTENGNANPRCAVIPSVGVWSTKTVPCNGMEGRYVNIVIPGNNKILTLCEVEVTEIESDDSIEFVCN